ncbi:snRNA-activating protein complex subunit 3 [Drosophila tropicalis]|uniref:snRNA-activating protein complex subunit 3 n=1 Tax=Drosophila tropicalis TaxID=46794 RepID=UPI0035AB89BA
MENPIEPPQPPINLQEFLQNYRQKLKIDPVVDKPEYISAGVKDTCSLDLIALPDDNPINAFQPGSEIHRANTLQPNPDLPVPKTYTAIQDHKAKSRANAFSRSQFSHRLVAPPLGSFTEVLPPKDYDLELAVRCYRPPRAHHRGFKLETPVFSEEFICLGSNYLTELRDKISCICNGRRFVDISEDPDGPLPALDTNPGYFFINRTFYNDMRNPENCDYSSTVRKWAATAHGIQHEDFTVERMENTRFIDLTVSLGSPLQYLHHGNCEHLFVISQVEVLRTSCDRSQYPYLRSFNTYNRRTCYMCGRHGYHFIVEQSRRQLHDPSYLCRTCFFSFNYVDGQKVGEFKAYRIYDSHTDETVETQPGLQFETMGGDETKQEEFTDYTEDEMFDLELINLSSSKET